MVAAMPGAVLAETIRRAATERDTIVSFTAGNFIGVGAIAIASYLGLATFVQNQSVLSALYYIGGGILIIFGVRALLHKAAYHKKHRKAVSLKEEWTNFSVGLILAISNPVRILFWLTLVGAMFYASRPDDQNALLGSVSVYAGMLAFYTILISLTVTVSGKVHINKLAYISRVLGVILIVYGVNMVLEGVG